MNAPKTFNKTISLVGACISNGYHHGDASLQGAINKLARPFACGERLLVGDGFFGTSVKPEASAARYTSVKINPVINDILGKHMVLNKKNDDDQWEWLKTEIPVGLLTSIMGIAVGYKTTMLPRNLQEIQKFLDGDKKASLNPYFLGFSGKISPYNTILNTASSKSWLIEGVFTVDEKAKTVSITEIPPLMKYDNFVKKLSNYAEFSKAEFGIDNRSTDTLDITLKFKGGVTWDEFRDRIGKMTKMLVTETMVFVKDGSVIEYQNITDYINEFRAHREFVRLQKSLYDIDVYSEELLFLKSKVEYLKFMLAAKRKEPEIEDFLAKYPARTASRLERTLLRDLNPEAIKRTNDLIAEETKKLQTEHKTKDSLQKSWEKLSLAVPKRSKTTVTRSMDLFDTEEIDGIEVLKVGENDIFDEETEETTEE
jgi:DNA gyrase/topoisomerase IV subunit A